MFLFRAGLGATHTTTVAASSPLSHLLPSSPSSSSPSTTTTTTTTTDAASNPAPPPSPRKAASRSIAAACSAWPTAATMSAPPSASNTTIRGSTSTTSLRSSSSQQTLTPIASAPSTPNKRSTTTTTTPLGTSPKKTAKPTPSAKSTPRKSSMLRPSNSCLVADLEKTPAARQNVVVCVRMRPSNEDGLSESQVEPIWSFDQEKNQITPTENHPSLLKRAGSSSTNAALSTSTSQTDLTEESSSSTYKFQFDKLLLGTDTTDDMYDSEIAPVVKAAMDGYNGTVFAYGQTGSGKTHTMSGSESEPGVIPRAVQQVFKTIEEEPNREFLLRVSYLEIYNETLKDLLAPLSGGGGQGAVAEATRPASPTKGGLTHSAGSSSTSSSLRIVEDQKSSRVVITGLREEIVTDPSTVLDLIQKGQEARHVGATDWNERSSRSHCVFQVTIESRAKSENGGGGGESKRNAGSEVRVSQLNLIDLAGSERAASQAERRKEGAFINKSLLTLGTVIAKLTEPPPPGSSSTDLHIPYRDSKLTRILQTSLSGNARIAVICTLSPDVKHAVETLSTLKFGKRCKMVVTSAKKGTSMDDKALLQKYRKELDALRAKLEAGSASSSSTSAYLPTPNEDGDASHHHLEEVSRESKQKLEALNEERERAQREVEEMEKKRGQLRGQIDHLTRLILTSQSVAKERKEGDYLSGTSADGTPRKRMYGGIERRGPRLSDLHSASCSSFSASSGRGTGMGAGVSQSPSLDTFASTPTLSGTKPFELEAELATLRKQLKAQIESRQSLIASHHAELSSRDAKLSELEEMIRLNEEELDEAEVAYDRLKNDRDEARRVALAEQEKAREHKRALVEEQEASRLLKIVVQSRGEEVEEAWKEQVDVLRAQLEEGKREAGNLREVAESAKKEVEEQKAANQALRDEIDAQRTAAKSKEDDDNDDDNPQEEFRGIVNGNGSGDTNAMAAMERASLLEEKAKMLSERERKLEKAEEQLRAQQFELQATQKATTRPLPIPTPSAGAVQPPSTSHKQLDDLEAELSIVQAQNLDLSEQLSRLRVALDEAEEAGRRTSTGSEADDRLAELQLELEGSKDEVVKLKTQLAQNGGMRSNRPLPIPSMSSPAAGARSTPSSPLKGNSISRLRTGSDAASTTFSKGGLNRGGSVREYRRYQPASEDDVFTGNTTASATGHRSSILGYKAIFDATSSSSSSSAVAGGTANRAERDEIERLNAVISSQRAIMSDLERSVASWKSRLKAQADLIQKLASSSSSNGGGGVGVGGGGLAITPPMQDGELPPFPTQLRGAPHPQPTTTTTSRALGEIQPAVSPSKFGTHFETSRSRFAGRSSGLMLESPDSTSSPRGGLGSTTTVGRSAGLGKETPYYGAHTYNRPPSSNVGLGVLPSSPTKFHSHSHPHPATPSSLWSHRENAHPPSSPSSSLGGHHTPGGGGGGTPTKPTTRMGGGRRKPRMTIENELQALKATPRVESNRSVFLVDSPGGEEGEQKGLRHKTSAAAFYI